MFPSAKRILAHDSSWWEQATQHMKRISANNPAYQQRRRRTSLRRKRKIERRRRWRWGAC